MRGGQLTYHELLTGIQAIADQIQILVSATDDLRCEIEWQARNSVDAELPKVEAANDPRDEDNQRGQSDNSPIESAESTATVPSRLQAYERALMRGSRGVWMDEWLDNEELDVQIPTELVFSVNESVWNDVIGISLCHIVDAECHCAETEGAPYVLAWQIGKQFLLRSLTDTEAQGLQALCQAEPENRQSARELEADFTRAVQHPLF